MWSAPLSPHPIFMDMVRLRFWAWLREKWAMIGEKWAMIGEKRAMIGKKWAWIGEKWAMDRREMGHG